MDFDFKKSFADIKKNINVAPKKPEVAPAPAPVNKPEMKKDWTGERRQTIQGMLDSGMNPRLKIDNKDYQFSDLVKDDALLNKAMEAYPHFDPAVANRESERKEKQRETMSGYEKNPNYKKMDIRSAIGSAEGKGDFIADNFNNVELFDSVIDEYEKEYYKMPEGYDPNMSTEDKIKFFNDTERGNRAVEEVLGRLYESSPERIANIQKRYEGRKMKRKPLR